MNIGEYHDRKKVLTYFYPKCYNDKQHIFYLPRFNWRRWAKPPLSLRNMNLEAWMKRVINILLAACICYSILNWSCADVNHGNGPDTEVVAETSGLSF